jgi:integrase
MAWIERRTEKDGRSVFRACERLFDPTAGRERILRKTFTTRAEAKVQCGDLEGGGRAPLAFLPERRSRMLDAWQGQKHRDARSPKTWESYDDAVQRIGPKLGALRIEELTTDRINAYVRAMQDELAANLKAARAAGTLERAKGRVTSESMVHRNNAHLGMAMRWWWRDKRLPTVCPFEYANKPRKAPPRSELAPWSLDQLGWFFTTAKAICRHYALYLAAVSTTLREADLCGLERRDVDLDARGGPGFQVRQQLYRVTGEHRIILEEHPKTASGFRTLPVADALVPELRRICTAQDGERERRGVCPAGIFCAVPDCERYHCDHQLVFAQPNGKPLWARNITNRDLPRILDRMQALMPSLRRITFHDLRRMESTYIQQDAGPKGIQYLLGHKDPNVSLRIYAHNVPEILAAPINRFIGQVLMDKTGGAS